MVDQIGVSPLALLAIIIIVSFAGWLRGLTGFGSAMVMAGPLALLLNPITAVTLILFLEAMISIPLMFGCCREVNWSLVKRLLFGATLAAPLGIVTLKFLPQEIALQVISSLLIIAVIFVMVGYKRLSPDTQAKEFMTGIISGFSCGLAGISGPPVVLYLLTGRENPIKIRATLIYYFTIIDFYVLSVFLSVNTSKEIPYVLAVVCFLIMWVFAFFGAKKIKKINIKKFKKVALWLILIGNSLSLLGSLLLT